MKTSEMLMGALGKVPGGPGGKQRTPRFPMPKKPHAPNGPGGKQRTPQFPMPKKPKTYGY